ncbi:MAG: hypothetical protein [Caudoviricetes sp.]|nr:MAG: hypothetical protein [Caudoviricetes sp.]
MEKVFAELDKRYVKIEELEKEVVSIVNKNFVTKDEGIKVLGKMESMQVELNKNTEMLTKIYESSEETKQLQIHQRKETETIKNDIESSKKKPTTLIWDKMPRVLRMGLSVVFVYVMTIVFSSLVGQEFANKFMHDNGVFVALVTLVAGFYFSGKEGK